MHDSGRSAVDVRWLQVSVTPPFYVDRHDRRRRKPISCHTAQSRWSPPWSMLSVRGDGHHPRRTKPAAQRSTSAGCRRLSHPVLTVAAMTSVARHRPAGAPHSMGGRPAGKACLAEMRARLALRCGGVGGVDGGEGAAAVVRAVDAAVGPLAGAGPLVDAVAVRSADDGDLVWCAQAVQRAINVLEGARSVLAAEAVRRRLPARRGEASGAETLVNATAVGGALARRIEREAQALDAQPPVADALGRGDINSDQAAMVAAAEVPDDVRRERASRRGARRLIKHDRPCVPPRQRGAGRTTRSGELASAPRGRHRCGSTRTTACGTCVRSSMR